MALIAMCGFAFALYVVWADSHPVPVAQPVAEPAGAPFPSFVSGSGLIESESENVAIGSPEAGVVTKVFVKAGDRVKEGSPLFQLDDRAVAAQMAIQESLLASSRARLMKLASPPRPVDIAPAEAQAQNAAANLADLRAQLALRESLSDKRAVSADEMNRRRYGIAEAEAALKTAQANLALLNAGAAEPDLEVARADVRQAEAQVASTQSNLDRLTVRAPFSGECLQVKVHAGEFAPVNPSSPLILFGETDHLRVRVDIDESEAWRVRPDAPAKAYARGNKSISVDLRFIRFEPYVLPKKSLTGESQERVDTRVLQALYQFDRKRLPLFAGQQMDVFVEADSRSELSAAEDR
ncbi:MAG: efflux RND transporter periplasmic adaptor subunit [Bryobacterales bacterium]|nr:efflux RND transporter periplasmic adaptor subunit [Bryobacterales bacterium]